MAKVFFFIKLSCDAASLDQEIVITCDVQALIEFAALGARLTRSGKRLVPKTISMIYEAVQRFTEKCKTFQW